MDKATPGVGWYDKHHLVPFTEFVPVPGFVREWLRLMTLPYSDFNRGACSRRHWKPRGSAWRRVFASTMPTAQLRFRLCAPRRCW
jgi:hypothetical protein